MTKPQVAELKFNIYKNTIFPKITLTFNTHGQIKIDLFVK